MEEFTTQDLIEELQAYAPPRLSIRKEGGVTSTEFAEKQGISRRTARKWLNQKVDEGVMVAETCKSAQGKEKVYYRNEKN